MTYKGYDAVVEYNEKDRSFSGMVLNTRDVIHFEGESVDELEQAFHDSVDFYLKTCAKNGLEPEKPFSGNIALRVAPELHRALVVAAAKEHKSLNVYLAESLQRSLESQPVRADAKVRFGKVQRKELVR